MLCLNLLKSRRLNTGTRVATVEGMFRPGFVMVPLIVGLAGSASADSLYFVEGVGGSNVGGELGERVDGGLALRIAGGYGADSGFGVEAFVAGDFFQDGGDYFVDHTLVSYGVAARFRHPLTRYTSAYARVGLNRTTLHSHSRFTRRAIEPQRELSGYRGRGITYGGGVQVKGKVRALGFLFWPAFFFGKGPKVTVSLWGDYARQITRLHHRKRASIDGSVNTLSVGFAIGSGF